MLDVLSLIFVADAKIIFRYDFVAPLNNSSVHSNFDKSELCLSA